MTPRGHTALSYSASHKQFSPAAVSGILGRTSPATLASSAHKARLTHPLSRQCGDLDDGHPEISRNIDTS
ncbi:hypothetical protein CERSUDRAFT_84459 [Gelatoporia subvermispora B]|uniref:Uncharacterized protein n=1 Tax=Ceriporiopsis subvermispora (strain B) TaxID=914234 RepID=M2PJH7_CERS8|nr:hypothetical protein CERSUDRAFT_84459 [Gelatoporia subvermispora B]